MYVEQEKRGLLLKAGDHKVASAYFTWLFCVPTQVDKFGKPTWRRLVEAVKDDVGGKNPALAQIIARKHPASCRGPVLHPVMGNEPVQGAREHHGG